MEWIIYFGAAGALLQYVPQWERFLNLIKANRKPFNCPLCFTWWTTLAGGHWITGAGLGESIFIAAGAAVLAELLWRKLMTI
jgi:hypothetical protein